MPLRGTASTPRTQAPVGELCCQFHGPPMKALLALLGFAASPGARCSKSSGLLYRRANMLSQEHMRRQPLLMQPQHKEQLLRVVQNLCWKP